MALHNNALFDIGMLCSGRSRLSREHSIERSSVGGVVQVSGDSRSRRTSATARSSFGGSGVGCPKLPRSRTSNEQAADSENIAPEKFQQPSIRSSGVLGEITNFAAALAPGITCDALNQAKPPPLPTTGTANAASCIISSIDCDVQNAGDPQHAMEYVKDIYQILQREETLCRASPNYMERQVHVNAKMRGILVDWLVSVQQKYKMKAETLFLAVSLLDRYLELKSTARRYLQLVGVTSLLIAAKFEEIYPPQIKDFVYVTDKAYSSDDIIKMEVAILGALDFKICRPTPTQFLERYQTVSACNETNCDLAQYLLELTLADYNMLQYSPSRLAAAAVLLSNKLLNRQPCWKPAAVEATHFNEQMLKECAKDMCALLEFAEQNPLQAVRKKFSQSKYHNVAKLSFAATASADDMSCTGARSDERRQSLGGNGAGAALSSRPAMGTAGAPPPVASSALFDKSMSVWT